MNISNKILIIGVIFSLLSSLRIPFLPELQLLCFILFTIYERRINYSVLLFLIMILCSHHYAIPDAVYRENSSMYPSIYTKQLGPLKILDFLTLFLAFFSFVRIPHLKELLKIRSIPFVLLITSFFGFIFANHLHIYSDVLLFLARSYILVFALFVNLVVLKPSQLASLSHLAIVCWISKMLFAIIFPHPNPWTRTQLGIEGIMYFAGDEYMFLPIYLSILIHYTKDRLIYKRSYIYIFIALILCVIAQRKGAIPIFLIFFMIVYFHQHNTFKVLSSLLKLYLVFGSIVTFLFLYFEDLIIHDEIINLAFLEYHTLAQVSWDSISNLLKSDFFGAIFGITPVGKYEVVNLPSFVDGFMTWGQEMGEKYRYQLWSFPFGRCILNSGFWGFFMCLFYSIRSIPYSLFVFYLTLSTIPFCFYENLTPVNAVATAFSLAFLNFVFTKKVDTTCVVK